MPKAPRHVKRSHHAVEILGHHCALALLTKRLSTSHDDAMSGVDANATEGL